MVMNPEVKEALSEMRLRAFEAGLEDGVKAAMATYDAIFAKYKIGLPIASVDESAVILGGKIDVALQSYSDTIGIGRRESENKGTPGAGCIGGWGA